MNCPKCNGYRLKPQKLENGLLAFACDNCQGSLLPMLQYLQWAEYHSTTIDRCTEFKSDETSQALLCPKCSGLMTKYRISAQSENRLDICNRCYETWLDSGEWQLLKHLHVLDKLPKIFTEAWQKNIRSELVDEKQQNRDKTHFGNDFEQIKTFKAWLEKYDKKEDVLIYLHK